MTRTTPRVINGLGDAAAPVAGSALTLDPRTYERSLDCVHCGLCAERCPTAAWDMMQFDLINPYAGHESWATATASTTLV